jgi:hypothetical protein
VWNKKMDFNFIAGTCVIAWETAVGVVEMVSHSDVA